MSLAVTKPLSHRGGVQEGEGVGRGVEEGRGWGGGGLKEDPVSPALPEDTQPLSHEGVVQRGRGEQQEEAREGREK